MSCDCEGQTVSTLEQIKSAREEIEKIRATMQAKVQEVFAEGARSIFREYPMVKSLTWTQYTPYFNDGDPCVFRSGAAGQYTEIGINSVDPYGDEPPNDDEGSEEYKDWAAFNGYREHSKAFMEIGYPKRTNPNYDPEYGAAYTAIKEFLGSFTEDDLEFLFGDHAQVTVTPKGVTVEEYEHE